MDIWVNGLKTTALHYIYKQTRKLLFGIGAKKADFYEVKKVSKARDNSYLLENNFDSSKSFIEPY